MSTKTKRPQTIPYEEFKSRLLKNPATHKSYKELQPEYQLACQMMDARLAKKMTQSELARRAKTGQAVISRLERMNAKPSFSLVQKIANALGTDFTIKIAAT